MNCIELNSWSVACGGADENRRGSFVLLKQNSFVPANVDR
jgi:hypothetical protein